MSRRRVDRARRLALECLEGRMVLATYFVSPLGSDGGLGSEEAPWQTLQKAANTVRAGDTVIVRPGNYVGFDLWTDGTAANRIVFRGEPGANITQRNPRTADGINLEGADYVTIEGFTVTGMPRAGIRSVLNRHVEIRNNHADRNGYWGIFSGFSDDLLIEGNVTSRSVNEHGIYTSNSGDRPTIRNNISWGNAACGIHMNGGLPDGGDGLISGALVEGNVIYANGALRGGAAINADGVRDSRFQNNLLYDNHATGIALFRQDGATGSANNIVANNTIVQAADGRFVVYIHNGSTGNTLRNNIFYTPHSSRGSIDISSDSLPGFSSDYNVLMNRLLIDDQWPTLTLGQWQAVTGQDLHSIVATPDQLFVNAAAGDYHLSPTSPALDRGTSQFAPSRDIEANLRPSGAGFDIGAYERVVVPPNQAPLARDDAATTLQGVAVEFGVLSNDSDPEGQPISVISHTLPAHGTLVALAGGNFRYTPASSFSGQDSFTYQVSDGTLLSNVATVTITVNAVNTSQASAIYRFDETSGSTAADSSGNNHHGTYVNRPTLGQAGVRGGNTAVALNGVNQYVALPSGPFGNPNNSSGYAVSFQTWFQAAPGTSGVILSQTGSGATPGGGAPPGYVPVVQLATDGKLRSSLFWHGSTAARITSPGSTTYNDGQWHHVAVTYANGVETLYIDGVAVGQQTQSLVNYASSYNYFLGTGYTSGWSGGNGGWHFFGGKLDEASLHLRALAATEVAEAYAAGKPSDPPPDTAQSTAHYRFDETSSSTAADSSGNGFHASYVNQPILTQSGVGGAGTAVTLNGVNQYVALPSDPFGNPNSSSGYAVSFESWFQAAPGTSGVILSQTGSGATPGGGAPAGYVPVVQLGTDGKLRSSLFWHGSTAARITSPGSTTYDDGQWHHVAVTYANGVETLYIDGVAVGQQTKSLTNYASSYNYFLGTGYTSGWTGGNGGWHFFSGKLDEAAIYQRALTATEVAQRYAAAALAVEAAAEVDAFGELVDAVPWDEAVDYEAVDASLALLAAE